MYRTVFTVFTFRLLFDAARALCTIYDAEQLQSG